MSDIIDRANYLAQSEIDSLLAERAARPHHRPSLSPDGVRICEDCGEAIDVARLRAAPDAVRCVDCQTKHEREEARYA